MTTITKLFEIVDESAPHCGCCNWETWEKELNKAIDRRLKEINTLVKEASINKAIKEKIKGSGQE
jgi:hypothetical protein